MTDGSRGTLYLIVGPSGAGKDTLIDASRPLLQQTHIYPRRTITRPVDSPGEDHTAVTADQFAALENAGQFALVWHAHGLTYGIPASIAEDLDHGKNVVINVSREVAEQAKQTFSPARVILVTAPNEILSARLAHRGRETQQEISERLQRQVEIPADKVVINDGPVETALTAFVKALRS